MTSDYPKIHQYHNVFNPWLQIKLLELFTFCKIQPGPESKHLHDILNHILDSSKFTETNRPTDKQKEKSLENQKYATISIINESIELITLLEDEKLIKKAMQFLGECLQTKDQNIRYIALNGIGVLCAGGKHESAKKIS